MNLELVIANLRIEKKIRLRISETCSKSYNQSSGKIRCVNPDPSDPKHVLSTLHDDSLGYKSAPHWYRKEPN